MNLNYTRLEYEVKLSWLRCRKLGLNRNIKPHIVMDSYVLQTHLEYNKKMTTVFNNTLKQIVNSIQSNYLFILTDPEGILLSWSATASLRDNLIQNQLNITPGISFSEKKIGTNAIALAMKLKEPVSILPEHHFCYYFSEWYCYAIPLIITDQIIGYLDVSAIEKTLPEEIIAVVNLLGEKIITEYSKKLLINENKLVKVLTSRQLGILELLTKGKAEIAIALELGISLPTVKYHKKEIYKKLDVVCISEAIAKAVKMGIISLY